MYFRGLTSALVVAMLLLAMAAMAHSSAQPSKISRDVLALYDGASEFSPDSTAIHQFAEMPLNHLGLRLTFMDFRKTLPDLTVAAHFRAVLLWLKADARLPLRVLEWVADVADAGVRVVLMGAAADFGSDEYSAVGRRLFGKLGLRHEGYEVDATYRAQVAKSDDVIAGGERNLVPLPPFPAVSREGDLARVHLSVRYPTGGGLRESVLVATGAKGGYVADNYAIAYDARAERTQWLIDPFLFFRRALFGDERIPRPDLTTLSGRRIYFSHVDGDGWNNISNAEHYRGQRVPSAVVVQRELIARYPDLPVTVGYLAGDGEPTHGGQTSAKEIAREIFALKQVEIGSHTYTHPYRWRFFEAYDRAQEQRLLREAREAAAAHPTNFARDAPIRQEADVDFLPRVYARLPFDLRTEIEGAIRAAEALAPPGKRAALYQWSGDTSPFEAAVRMTREAGVRNINGGDSRLDSSYPSLTYVAPIARSVDSERQIYAVNSNDYIYRAETGQDHALLFLEETLRNTERPRRLKGFNLYYHMYAGERSASLNAVRYFLDAARSGPYVPITAARYAAMADGFFSLELWREDANRWSIRNRGALETMRLDDAADMTVDLAASIGILGMRRHGDAIYVALDPAVDAPVLALRTEVRQPGADGAVRRPYLSESRWRVSHLVRSPCGLSFQAAGFGAGLMAWRDFQPGRYRLEARRGADLVWTSAGAAGVAGQLDFTIEATALQSLAISISCLSEGEK